MSWKPTLYLVLQVSDGSCSLIARYAQNKLTRLESLNTQLDVLRYQTRLLLDFQLIAVHRYEYAIKLIDEIGIELGGWIKQQNKREHSKN